MGTPPQRTGRLAKFFYMVVDGKRALTTTENAKLFFEAVVAQENRSACVERIIASPQARSAIHSGLRFDISPDFIKHVTAPFIQYLSDPAIKQLCNGQFLQEILTIIVEPRTLWDALMALFGKRQLDECSVRAFAWMLSELLSFPPSSETGFMDDARKIVSDGSLLQSSSLEVRVLGHKIEHVIRVRSSNTPMDPDMAPGGRHDNDFAEAWKIAIYPTADEFLSTVKPFYRRADEVASMPAETRIAAHIDNQFRLLREDLLSELRDDIQIARGQKKGRRSVLLLQELTLRNIHCTENGRFKPLALSLACGKGLGPLYNLDPRARKTYLLENRSFLKRQALGCFIRDGEIIAFGSIERDLDNLLLDPPEVAIRVLGMAALEKALICFKLHDDIQFLMVDAPVFAYEPILRCLQGIMDLPLSNELLQYGRGLETRSGLVPDSILDQFTATSGSNIQDILKTQKPVQLDPSQFESFLRGLKQNVSLIQGPPGTGKSFIGALLTRAFHEYTKETILVMCYTNHALDQFLEDLLDIGIDSSAIVRLGSKSSQRTSSLSLQEQKIAYRRSPTSFMVIDRLRSEAYGLENDLKKTFDTYQKSNVATSAILEFLEFEHPDFHEAFMPPAQDNGMVTVGKYNRGVDSQYLFDIWSHGKDPQQHVLDALPEESQRVWKLDHQTRKTHIQEWKRALLEEQVANMQSLVQKFDPVQDQLTKVWNEKTAAILKSKRIIGCTTTAAAMYSQDLRQAQPGIVLLEEAGEILESHVLTAMGPETKQLVLIGDHQQLRPKINNYALSVEKGEGYDLNRSLFERLVLAGYPHSTLAKQHRMCPEISSLVKHLTYPELQDDPKTLNRPRCRGLQDCVVFIDHRNLESHFWEISDRRDENTKGSKRNIFEVEMVLKIVKYLGQQGYGTDKLVVLTPYLGQLHLLRDYLKKETDPVLNDLDSYDLVRAGLLSAAGARQRKRPIHLSTIDNYQGEESDIVIVSLTRSNEPGDIGFMAAPQRLNVLLSRAREALIMIGNSATFTNSRKGKEIWTRFIDHLNENHHLYDGLPVKCERHPQRRSILRTKDDFDTECPDGGCPLPCGVMLRCGVHACPSKCHQLSDHSKMECYKIVEWTCSRGHRLAMTCFQKSGACHFCNAEDEAKEKRRQRDMRLEVGRVLKQKEYERTLANLQDEIEEERRLKKDEYETSQRQQVLAQHRAELTKLKSNPDTLAKSGSNNEITDAAKQSPNARSHGSPSSSPDQQFSRRSQADKKDINSATGNASPVKSSAQADWDHQKYFERAQSDEIDTLMGMIGLENVKAKFLTIKAQVDTAIRQNVDLKSERFGTVLVGNPGTGKTTVARIYAKFLSSTGVLPGNTFEETTGSRLANAGVPGCEKLVNKILNSGGGVLFIDEAYQLTGGNSNGANVVDYLLGEVENLTGKLVVVLAGYRSNMEKFFGQNPGLPSRFPHEIRFEDYNDDELREILKYRVGRKYGGRMRIEGGMDGLYSRIVARRVGRGRGKEGFANARAVENALLRISERQASRISRERRNQQTVDVMLLTKEDLIGPEPSQALGNCSAWQKLQDMIGLQSVKDTIQALLDSIQYNYRRELEEKPLVDFTLNRVFLGSPGTGKTSIAKLYGQILVDIGLLSNGEVVVKNPADFIGSVLGESEKNTKGILASTVGKVLVIDEAYGLFGGGSKSGGQPKTDTFKSAVVDTIVAEVQSTPGDDRCVLLLGYQDQMAEMFQNVNPGLQRRFPLDSAFMFEDFTDAELGQILDLKLKQQGFETCVQGRKAALDVLSRSRNRPNFGNAGEIDILLNETKLRHQKRLLAERSSGNTSHNASQFKPEDFDEDHDRGERAETNIPMLFAGNVGCEKVVEQLEDYRQTVRNMRKLDIDPREQIPFNFLFRGPPGTGKTTTARKMGKVYYDMGFLSSADVIESSATDLIGEYIGQTGPKTQAVLEKALGKILLVDEAYRLAEGHFAKEAIDEIVDCITKPKFRQKLIIILAGYDNDINRLMAINPGLTSRFPESIPFNGLNPEDCVQLLTTLLQSRKDKISPKLDVVDINVLEHPSATFKQQLNAQFSILSQISNWANARDVGTLAQAIFRAAVKSITNNSLVLNESMILQEIGRMVTERTQRQVVTRNNGSMDPRNFNLPVDTQSPHLHAPSTKSGTKTESTQNTSENPAKTSDSPCPSTEATEPRDPGVTDDIWNQLQEDKAREETREHDYQELLEVEREAQDAAKEAREREEAYANQAALERGEQDDDEERKRYERERLRRELERRAIEDEADRILKQREQEQQRRKQEQKAQQKLRDMGVCPVGYRWNKQASGYRCAGGSHYVSNNQLGM